ncbi:MAG: radical SAM protein [Eubacterium sp.]
MKVVEKFISINGEGRRAGELAVFIRFKGCNLNCSYCDTKWANEPACDYEELSPDKICEYVSETGIKNVTLTGGEPLLQKDIRSLVEKLLNKSDIRVEIETNGAVDIAPLANAFSKEKLSLTMDYKLPSSGCEEKMLLSNMESSCTVSRFSINDWNVRQLKNFIAKMLVFMLSVCSLAGNVNF